MSSEPPFPSHEVTSEVLVDACNGHFETVYVLNCSTNHHHHAMVVRLLEGRGGAREEGGREGGRKGGREGGKEGRKEDGKEERKKMAEGGGVKRERRKTHNCIRLGTYGLDVDGHVVLEVHLLNVRGAGVNVTWHRKIKRHHHWEEPLQE